MADLVPYQAGFLIPRNHIALSAAYVIQPNDLNYQGDVVIALTREALWLCTPDKNHDIIHLQSIRRVSVQEFRGFTKTEEIGGKRVYINPRDTWGVVVEHQKIGSFTYTLSFMTHFANAAYDWQQNIQRAISDYDKDLYGQ